MNYLQKLSIVALTLLAASVPSTWAQVSTSPTASTQQSNAQSTNSIDRKTDKKIERRDERAEKRAITQRQHAHRKHPTKVITP